MCGARVSRRIRALRPKGLGIRGREARRNLVPFAVSRATYISPSAFPDFSDDEAS